MHQMSKSEGKQNQLWLQYILMQMPFRRYILLDHNSITCIIPEWFTQKRERMNNEQNSSDLD